MTFWRPCNLHVLDDTSACDLRLSDVFFVLELSWAIDVGVAENSEDDPEDDRPEDEDELINEDELIRISNAACSAILSMDMPQSLVT